MGFWGTVGKMAVEGLKKAEEKANECRDTMIPVIVNLVIVMPI